MTVLVSPSFWFDSGYLSNAGDRIAMGIMTEDAGKTWWDFEKEIEFLFPNFSGESVCAAFHVVATQGRVPTVGDIGRERRTLYDYTYPNRLNLKQGFYEVI